MKKISFLCILFLISDIAFSQKNNTQVTYKAEYLVSEMQDKINEQSLEAKEYINKYIENFSKIETVLIYNNKECLFKSVEKLDINEDMFYKLCLVAVTDNKIRYKNKQENKSIVQVSLLDETYIYEDLYNKHSWEILKDTATISGFKCIKAKTKRMTKPMPGLSITPKEVEIYAWFTPDIASSFGPCGFDNLPGLVLSVTFGNVHVYATEIKSIKDFKIYEPTEGVFLKNEDELIAIGLKHMKKLQDID